MQEIATHMCIGGPHDGRVLHAHGKAFRVPVCGYIPLASDLDTYQPVDASIVTYVLESFGTDRGTVTFWRPEDQSPHETMLKLFSNYRPVVG